MAIIDAHINDTTLSRNKYKLYLLISQWLSILVLYDVHFTSVLNCLGFYQLFLPFGSKNRIITDTISTGHDVAAAYVCDGRFFQC